MPEQSNPATSNAGPQDVPEADALVVASSENTKKPETREEYLALLQKSTEDLIAQRPELAPNPAFNPSSYVPMIDYVVTCKEHLGPDGYQRFSEMVTRYMGEGGAENFDKFRAESLALLEGRPDLQTRWDEFYGPRERWQEVLDVIREGKSGQEEKAGV